MELNADFSRRVVVHAAGLPWVASPIPGVERRMLDRIGDEIRVLSGGGESDSRADPDEKRSAGIRMQ